MKRILTSRRTSSTILLFSVFLSCSCARVPRVEQSTTVVTASPTRLDLNRASVAELEKLPGIGAILAQRIIDHRSKYGSFRRVEHLMMVRGISEQKFVELQPLIFVE